MDVTRADVAIVGGGLGGCSAALAAARLGHTVVLTEELNWLGGQLTNQAVPPDEYPWIESFAPSASYRALRDGIRQYYRSHLPLSARAQADPNLNPGNGWVSRICHDPRVAVAVLHQMLAPHALAGRFSVQRPLRPIEAWSDGDRVVAVKLQNLRTGAERLLEAPFFLDATAYGDVLELAGVEHVLGAESRASTGEPHAADQADPRDQQSITVCFALEHRAGEEHTIERPRQYARWRDLHPRGWPGPLLGWTTPDPVTHEPLRRPFFTGTGDQSWWDFRRILDRTNFERGFAAGDITVVNWPQNDYWFGPVVGVDAAERARNIEDARQLSLSLLYWLQTEAPRPDDGHGYPGLRLREDVVGDTTDGLAAEPYVRESRRIVAEFIVSEQHIAHPLRRDGPERFEDSVGVGCYRIDLHPRVSGAGYLDLGCWPFQIPLGALVPIRVQNLLPGGKNLGVTHIANGAFRVHPVEWSVGEAAGTLAALCLERHVSPHQVRGSRDLTAELQSLLRRQGVQLEWPSLSPV